MTRADHYARLSCLAFAGGCHAAPSHIQIVPCRSWVCVFHSYHRGMYRMPSVTTGSPARECAGLDFRSQSIAFWGARVRATQPTTTQIGDFIAELVAKNATQIRHLRQHETITPTRDNARSLVSCISTQFALRRWKDEIIQSTDDWRPWFNTKRRLDIYFENSSAQHRAEPGGARDMETHAAKFGVCAVCHIAHGGFHTGSKSCATNWRMNGPRACENRQSTRQKYRICKS